MFSNLFPLQAILTSEFTIYYEESKVKTNTNVAQLIVNENTMKKTLRKRAELSTKNQWY